MSALLVGCARVSTHDQDLTAQRDALAALGAGAERTYVDHGLTSTNRERPGLREALAACRGGDALVVTKLDRLARSLPDAREILEDLTRREVKLSIDGSVHDPTDPSGDRCSTCQRWSPSLNLTSSASPVPLGTARSRRAPPGDLSAGRDPASIGSALDSTRPLGTSTGRMSASRRN